MSGPNLHASVDPPRFFKGSAAAAAAPMGCARPWPCSPRSRSNSTARNSSSRRPSPTPNAAACCATASPSRPPHFDMHQSGTINSLGCQGCMFDNLIRRDPRDSGKTIIPDLAHSWEIAKDGKTYTFFLRKGVQFHDGAELTADDVKATFDRICQAAGRASASRAAILFKAVSEINARDKYTVEFKLSRAAARQLHHVGDSPAAGTSSSARRRWRTTTTICARSRSIPAPARSRASGGSRTKSG